MIRPSRLAILLVLACLPARIGLPADELPKGVACLLEDSAAELLPKLTNPQGDPGEGHVETDVVFSGREAIKITVFQRYCNFIAGWAYRITEKPKEGEYRYLRFAWKSDGLSGIMVQLHDERDWNIRYTSGANKFGWATQALGETLPQEWTVVTIDLFKDFGEREIHGIALTTFDGAAGYFDHIYLARSIEELDGIDATGLSRGGPLKLTPEEVEKHWRSLSSNDASIAYRSFWTLAAAGDSAKTVLADKLGGSAAPAGDAPIKEWLKQLDDEEYAVREEATRQLTTHFALARKLIEEELAKTESAEVKARLGQIIAATSGPPSAAERIEIQTRRILEIIKEREKSR